MSIGFEHFRNRHETAGMANASSDPNCDFVDVGFDSILVAKINMDSDTELFAKYNW